MAGPHHRTRQYIQASAAIRAAAYSQPDTRCWRCGRTLADHPRTKTGKPPTWEAGHLHDGQTSSPLLPEVKSCNASAGASMGNRRRHRTPLAW